MYFFVCKHNFLYNLYVGVFFLQMCLSEFPVWNSTIQRRSGRRTSVKTTLYQFHQPSTHFMLRFKLLPVLRVKTADFLDAT
jgi:hypothetical protein